MDETQRLGQTTFDELIDYKTSEVNIKLDGLKSKLREINVDIVSLEAKQHPSYLRNLEDKKKSKKRN
ncbi:MAG: hypothetical protein HC831_09870 [Chloroflexia bacterium]|nr:hypothetical protein [Chloroflexia bacterium]